jgi:CRISPR/Cas system-associated endoribonuclease Cas2
MTARIMKDLGDRDERVMHFILSEYLLLMQHSPFRGQYPSSLASKLVSSLLSQPALEVERDRWVLDAQGRKQIGVL